MSSGHYAVFINGKKVLVNYKNNYSAERRVAIEASNRAITIMIKFSLFEKKNFRVLALTEKGRPARLFNQYNGNISGAK